MGSSSPPQELVHLVAVPWVIPGHVNPLLHLCSKLAALGSFQITFINTFENHERMFKSREPITREGIDFVGVSDGMPERGANDHPPPGMEGLKEVIKSSDGLQRGVEELLESMIHERGIPIKAIISDLFLHWIQDIATRFKLVRVAFSTTSATFDLVTLHMRRLRSEGFVPVKNRTTGDKKIDFFPGIPSFSPFDLPLAWYEEHPIIPFFEPPYERLFQADWILSGTFQALEPDIVSIFHHHYGVKNYLPIGPFLPDEHMHGSGDGGQEDLRAALSSEDLRCLEWLDSRPNSSVLYVAFGSIAVMPSDQFQELLHALDHCCAEKNVGVLWSIRPNLVDGEFPREIFDAFLERSGDGACVVSWAPQMRVLRHVAVGGFITHCGWNSALEGMCAGVAMIGWPCLSEQNLNCSFLAKRKLMLRVKDHSRDGILGREEIARAVDELMHGEIGKEIRANVGAVKIEARKAVATGGSSHGNLQAFVNALAFKV
ncbi:hypothetical protein SELMODRAFT_110114 [Selaginella moellendorffii]|uniref:Glycosyltransferase n=1 Tax=Selaginella moellendorffii TaxID=88036 RepID=D8S6S5_SELML|nr:linamarin synthase 1 [Selaginella moellendorffii]EFJ19859.1 hypothetical protein SELMODRAFT_110114 [Selaginella moellendorffii]|eukprot:XP_002978902.1 linamarin synthase 1 [Selaginella moellendorffii]